MLVCRTWRVVLGAVVTALLLSASRVHAQSIVDARRVEFTPSPDHTLLTASGAPAVERYSIDVFVAGTRLVIATANLGKPAPDPDGMIRIDFVSLLSVALQTGTTYEASVVAIGPGGRSGGMISNTFSFGGGVACAPVVSPFTQSFAAAGGSGSTTV